MVYWNARLIHEAKERSLPGKLELHMPLANRKLAGNSALTRGWLDACVFIAK